MRKTSVFAGVSALAMMAAAAQAGPAAMDLEQMDAITAGNAEHVAASGGAIVGNDSSATITSSGEVDLSDGVQAEARALNLVNAAESTVANGVNVFDGNIDESGEFGLGTEFNVTQRNEISQEQRRVASVPFYERAEANVDRATTDSGSASSSLARTEVSDVTDIVTSRSEDVTTSEGNIEALSTLLGQNVQAGRGLAGAGEMEVDFVGGEVLFRAGGGLTIGGTTTTNDDGDTETDGGISFNGDVLARLELPEFQVELRGAGCAVQNGSCSAVGTFSDTEENMTDQSSFHSLEESRSSSREWNRTLEETIRAPFTLTDAQAEYVVVDDSELTVQSAYMVALAGGAQANMRGMNVVNAAGSAVANGVNVARQNSSNLAIAGDAPFLNLTQTNIINHSR